jgi:histidinol-phosphate aminotransferase
VSFEYERVLTPQTGLRLHLNENTAGCSPAVIKAMQALTRHDVAIYPDYTEAIQACSRRLGVDADSLLLTNGLDEGILAIAVAALRNGPSASPFEAIVVVPAFDMYAACSDAAGGRVVEVPLGAGFAFPLERVLGAVTARTRIVWLTNPNNPTGQMIPADAIAAIAAAVPDAIVMVDEAYADFSAGTLIGSAILAKHPNLVVGRTFAKAYGLAGLRLGALIGDPRTLVPLRRVVPPYSINACVAAVLPAAVADTAYYDWYLDQVEQSKALLYGAFDRLGIHYWESAANFVLARFDGDCPRLAQELSAKGVHVRDRSRDSGCAGCLRITAGVVEHTQTFISALGELL